MAQGTIIDVGWCFVLSDESIIKSNALDTDNKVWDLETEDVPKDQVYFTCNSQNRHWNDICKSEDEFEKSYEKILKDVFKAEWCREEGHSNNDLIGSMGIPKKVLFNLMSGAEGLEPENRLVYLRYEDLPQEILKYTEKLHPLVDLEAIEILDIPQDVMDEYSDYEEKILGLATKFHDILIEKYAITRSNGDPVDRMTLVFMIRNFLMEEVEKVY